MENTERLDRNRRDNDGNNRGRSWLWWLIAWPFLWRPRLKRAYRLGYVRPKTWICQAFPVITWAEADAYISWLATKHGWFHR